MDLKAELDEATSEISRHHRDFEAIRQITHGALDGDPENEAEAAADYWEALRQIRGIVG